MKFYLSPNVSSVLGSVQVLHQRVGGGGGLTEIADAADALRGGGGSQVKIADVILEQIF